MPQERSFTQKLSLFLKGLAMGAANKVPGVSGGTVSFVLSFYEEMIYSFQKINFKALKLLVNGRFLSFYRYVNGQFLLLVMGGSVFSYFSVSLVLDYFLEHYELYVWSWFFGMIIGSVLYLYKDFIIPFLEKNMKYMQTILKMLVSDGYKTKKPLTYLRYSLLRVSQFHLP